MSGWLLLLLPALLAVSLPAAAQTAPGTRITNVAICSHGPAPVPPGGSPTVLSNPAVTLVGGSCFAAPPLLRVAPSGTVAPGAMLTYTLAVTAGPQDASGAVLRLPLDPALDAPSWFTDGSAPLDSGGSVSVSGAFDPLTRVQSWSIVALPADETVRVQLGVRVSTGASPDGRIALTGEADALGCAGTLIGNTVVSPVVPAVLTLVKAADRPAAAVGDAIRYTLTLAHVGSAPDLDPVRIVDVLPAGLRLLSGSVRIDGAVAADPTSSADGRRLLFDLGPLTPGQNRVVTFDVVVSPGVRRGERVNRAWATAITANGAPLRSPDASAVVLIHAGAFFSESHLVGRVFVDRDGDRLPGRDEPGVPGVLVLMEHGKGAVTDASGRWNIMGVRPGLHTLRVDPSTLPEGLTPLDGGHPWAGSELTRFVEARSSTLAVADFPLGPADAPVCEIGDERHGLRLPAVMLVGPAGGALAGAPALVETATEWLRGLPGGSADAPAVLCEDASGALTERPALSRLARRRRTPSGEPAQRTATHGSNGAVARQAAPADPFDDVLRTIEPGAHILHPLHGSTTDRNALHIDVVYPLDSNPALTVNGERVDPARIGMTSVLPARGLAAARYVGVGLEVGENRIQLRAGPRAAPVEHVITLPGPAVGLRLGPAGSGWVADGRTHPVLRVEALDAAGMLSPESRSVTLTAPGLDAVTPDAEPMRDGFQVLLDGGVADVRFAPLPVPGRVHVVAVSERLEQDAWLDVQARADRWAVLGQVEGTLAGDAGAEGDGGAAPMLEDPLTDDGGRVAVFARGPLGARSRLTVSLDTARSGDEQRLFGRDEPDRFFPVAGDESRRTEEAPSRGPLFARLDGPRGFVQWGDFASGLERTELLRYDRRLEGLRGRAAAGRIVLEAFGAETEQLGALDVFAADGSSGPFLLSRSPVVARSELVVVETRDRHETTRVIERTIKLADVDYNLDPISGTLLLRAPLAPFDAELNPVRIVVLYETRGGGAAALVTGARVALGAGTKLEAGLSGVYEERAGADLRLYGLDLRWDPLPGTSVRAELAASDAAARETAARLDVRGRPNARLGWELSYRDLPPGFANPSLLAAPEVGVRHTGAKLLWEPERNWRVRFEAFAQDDARVDLERRVAAIDVERRFDAFAAFGGLRRVGSESPTLGDAAVTQVRAGARGSYGERWTAELSHERALDGEAVVGFPDRTSAALGYRISHAVSLFVRQELESGSGPTRDRTVLGLESRLPGNTRAVQQYSLEGGMTGSALRSLSGLERIWNVNERSALRFSAARLDTLEGSRDADYTTIAGGYEYHAAGSLLSSRYELRLGEREDRHLLTASGALRASEAWTAFVRERLFISDGPAADATRSEALLGAAYRPLGGRWQALLRLDAVLGSGTVAGPGAGLAGGALSEPIGSTAPAGPAGPPGIGTAPGRGATLFARDRLALSLAAGARLTARQRLAATTVWLRQGADGNRELPAWTTWLLSLHYTRQVGERWTVGGSLRRFDQRDLGGATFGHGVEVGHLALRDLWVVAGYNFAGIEDNRFAGLDGAERGPFVSVRFKFDETSTSRWFGRGLRLDRD